MKIGEFVIDLFVDAAKGELTIGNLVKSMGDLQVASVGEIAILTALADRLVAVTQASMKSAFGFEEYAASTGASTDALQKWQAAAKMVGISNEDVASSLGMISQGLAGLPYGKQTPLLNLLHPLGITLDELKSYTPEKLLERVRESPAFKKMGEAEQRLILSEAGLARMQRVLMKGEHGVSDKEFAQFIRDAGVMSKRDIAEFGKMHKDFLTIEALATRIGRTVATWFSGPTITFLEKQISAMREIADFIESKEEKEDKRGIGEKTKDFWLNQFPDIIRSAREGAVIEAGKMRFDPRALGPHDDLFRDMSPVPPIGTLPAGAGQKKADVTMHQTNHLHGVKDDVTMVNELDRATRLGITSMMSTAVA